MPIMLGCEPLNQVNTSKHSMHGKTHHIHACSERISQASELSKLKPVEQAHVGLQLGLSDTWQNTHARLDMLGAAIAMTECFYPNN